MTDGSKEAPAKNRETLAPYVENLVWRLFEERGQPMYARGKIPAEHIKAFAKDSEVFAIACDFQRAIRKAWQRLYPDQPLKFVDRSASADQQSAPSRGAAADASAPQGPRRFVPPRLADDHGPDKKEQRLLPRMNPPERSNAEDRADPPADAPAPAMPAPEAPNPEVPNPDVPNPEAPTKPQQARSESPPGTAPIQPGQVPDGNDRPAAQPAPKARFRLPNGRVGVDYAAAIEGRGSDQRPLRILDVKPPPELGLRFDPEHGELRGTPRIDGDHRLALRWTFAGESASYPGECLLIVNPDPKSLWKIVEPPADAPYRKPHLDSRRIVGDGVRILAASRRGRSHEHAGSFRDDDFFVHAAPDSGWSILIVADGAGSAQFSREGARLAVARAGAVLSRALAGDTGVQLAAALDAWDADPSTTAQSMNKALHYLFHQAGMDAVQAIEQAAKEQNASVRDYSTTLLAAVAKPHNNALFLSSFWMGDGAIAAYGPRNKVRLMGAPDSGEFAGQTRFLDRAALSEQGFAKRIGIGYFRDLTAVMLMTDGVSDPYFETDKGLLDATRWDRLWDALSPLLASPEPEAESQPELEPEPEPEPDQALVEWLDFFSPGNHDDRTIALLQPSAHPGE